MYGVILLQPKVENGIFKSFITLLNEYQVVILKKMLIGFKSMRIKYKYYNPEKRFR